MDGAAARRYRLWARSHAGAARPPRLLRVDGQRLGHAMGGARGRSHPSEGPEFLQGALRRRPAPAAHRLARPDGLLVLHRDRTDDGAGSA